MKIIAIRLKNINSLKGEHEVDFSKTPLADAGLFAIVGPTGAGKSTLLDVITLALFNQIPRLSEGQITKNVILEQGVVLTHHTTDGYAEVDYEVKGVRYRASWSIAYNRNNNLNDRKHELAIVNEFGDVSEIIEDKKSNVAAVNERIIGLNYEQFVQSMVLAQGQFAKLLQANKAERSKLLEEITGAKIYRKIGYRVYQKHRDFKEKLRSIADRKSEVKCLSEEEMTTKQHAFKALIPLIDKEKESLDEMLVFLNIKEQVQKTEQDLMLVLNREADLIKQKEQLAPDLILLDEHDKFAPFQGDFQAWKRLQSDILQDKVQLEIEKQKHIDTVKQRSILHQEISAFLTSEPKEGEVLLELNNFQTEVLDLLALEREVFDEAKSQSQRIDDAVLQLNKTGLFSFQRSESALEELQEMLLKVTQTLQESQIENTADLRQKRDKLEIKRLQFSRLVSEKKLLDKMESNQQAAQDEIAKEQQKINGFTEELIRVSQELEILAPKVKEAELRLNRHQKEMGLKAHRANLVDGEPCPLCGAEEHPYAVHFEEDLLSELKKNHELLREKFEQLKKIKIEQETFQKSSQSNIENLKEKVSQEQKELSDLKLCVHQVLQELSLPVSLNIAEIDTASNEVSKEAARLNQLEKYFSAKESLDNLVQRQEEYNQMRQLYQKRKTKRTAKYDGNDIIKDTKRLEEQWNNLGHAIVTIEEKLKERTNRLNENENTINQIVNVLLPGINALGVSAVNLLDDKFLSAQKAQSIREKKNQIDQAFSQWTGERASLERTRNAIKEKDVHPDNIPVLQGKIEALKNALGAREKAKNELEFELKEDNKSRERKAALEKEEAQLQAELNTWEVLLKLIGDASGNKFSNFVQDLTLDQLIDFANVRLDGLSDRYYLSKPAIDDQKTLRVIDKHLGNTERSVTSLSGGETFKLSLALALGLSDLAAQNIQIESLFIDEGFGTLDPESLDAAISVLEDMQHSSNKSIGIISHVAELKDRIGTKVKLVPCGGGYSKIEVV